MSSRLSSGAARGRRDFFGNPQRSPKGGWKSDNFVVPHLFLGGIEDARRHPKTAKLCVANEFFDRPLSNTKNIQIVYEGSNPERVSSIGWGDVYVKPDQLEKAAQFIDKYQKANQDLLVHCAMGIERSALTIVYWLMTRKKMTFDQAYDFLIARRPMVVDRRAWLEAGLDRALYTMALEHVARTGKLRTYPTAGI